MTWKSSISKYSTNNFQQALFDEHFLQTKVFNRRLSDKTNEKRQNDSEKWLRRLKEGHGVKGDLSKYSTDDFK